MSNKEKWLAVCLMIGTILTETHSILMAYNKGLVKLDVDAFIFLDFSMSVLWYFKMLFENLLIVVIFFIVAMLQNGYSKKFFKIILINVFYHVFDFFSFVLNYKQTYQLYWIILASIAIWQLFIIFTYDNKMRAV